MKAETLLQVLELLPGPALVVGPGGEVLGLNERARCWLGSGRDGVAGRPAAVLFADPPERVAGFLADCARADGKVSVTLTPTAGAGGGCRVEGLALCDRSGGVGGATTILHLLPDEPGGEREGLRARLGRAEGLIDRLAHDLRNPVSALSGALHLSRRATSTEDVAWAHEAMERQLESLVRQVDELLDFSRVARGKVELSRRRLDAATSARAAVSSARPMLEERGLQLTLSTAPGDLAVVADPARLEQMLSRMIEHVAGSSAPGDFLRLVVARERDAVAFRVGGRGREGAPADHADLGLMLIRQLAEAQGGSASGPGEVGEFIVRLPAAAAGPADDPRPAEAAGARILVVDDNVDTARGTARLLELAGHDVRVAHDGREALQRADEHRPRFILLDISLPIMDGYEVARRLRGDPRHRDVVIIAVSGYSADDIRPASESGFDHHLVKPVDFEALRAIIEAGARSPL